GEMQEVIEEFQLDHYLKSEGKGEDKKGKEDSGELTARLRDARKRMEEHLLLTDTEDFDALVASRFSSDTERSALQLVEQAYRSKLINSRDELSRVDSSGITV